MSTDSPLQQQLDEPVEMSSDFEFLGRLAERVAEQYFSDDEDDDLPTEDDDDDDEIPGPSGVSTPAAGTLPAECVGRPVSATPPEPAPSSSSSVRRNPARAAKQGVSYVVEEDDDIHDYCECVKLFVWQF